MTIQILSWLPAGQLSLSSDRQTPISAMFWLAWAWVFASPSGTTCNTSQLFKNLGNQLGYRGTARWMGIGNYNNVGHSCFELKAWGRSGQGVGGVDTVGVGEVPGGGDWD